MKKCLLLAGLALITSSAFAIINPPTTPEPGAVRTPRAPGRPHRRAVLSSGRVDRVLFPPENPAAPAAPVDRLATTLEIADLGFNLLAERGLDVNTYDGLFSWEDIEDALFPAEKESVYAHFINAYREARPHGVFLEHAGNKKIAQLWFLVAPNP